MKWVAGKFGTFFVPNTFTYKYAVYCAYYALKHIKQRITSSFKHCACKIQIPNAWETHQKD